MLNFRKFAFFAALVIIFVFGSESFASDGSKKLYNEYLKAYNEFKQAIDKGADEDTSARLSEKCKTAFEKYNNAIKNGSEETQGQNSEASNSAAGASSNTAQPAAAMTLDETINLLHSAGSLYKADEIISRLEYFSNNSTDEKDRTKASIELANAYSKLKNDHARAEEVLSSTIKNLKSGNGSAEAKLALARAKFIQYKNSLMGMIGYTRKDAAELKASYDSISWTKPIEKLKAYMSYKKTLFDYRKAIAIYKSYRDDGEKKENYYSFEFLTDIVGKRPELGVEDAFEYIAMSRDDDGALIRLMTDNNESWYARWWAINNAKSTIDMTYFILKDDAFGKSLMGLLLKKARQGVKVRLMVDDRGDPKSTIMPAGYDYLQELVRETNIEVKIFNPMFDTALPQIFSGIKNVTASNHQKIIVVDGFTCITGGRNIAVEYLASPLDNPPTIFRDTDVLIQSAKIASELKAAFEYEYNGLGICENVSKDLFGNLLSNEKELLKSAESMEKWISGEGLVKDKCLKKVNAELATYKHMVNFKNYVPFNNSENVPALILSKSGYRQEKDEISDALIAFIDSSSDEIIIQNPYVVLTEKAKAAIKRASARGVRVIMHTNSPKSDNQIMSQAFFLDDDWMEFMQAVPSLKLFVFTENLTLHAKVFVFDRAVSVVGTYNMDYISEQINCENVCVIKSPVFTRDCRDRIMQDISTSKEYKIGIGSDGKPYEIFGPGNFLSGTKKTIMDLLRKIKILRPLI